jgi:glycosyltransferase involved in cell wall biosynthesis
MILERLCRRNDVTLVGLAWSTADEQALAEWIGKAQDVHIIPHPRRQQFAGLLGNPIRPFQVMVSTSSAFAQHIRQLIQQADDQGRPYDAVHVEHLRGAAAADLRSGLNARVVYDAVDCLAELAHLAQHHSPCRSVRIVARSEEWRTRRAEDHLLRFADVITVAAERDRQAMLRDGVHEHVLVIPNGVERACAIGSLPDAPQAVFTGKLSYHANQAAVRWLLDHVWPRVQRGIPSAGLTIAGADPPNWLRERAQQLGVELVANPDAIDPIIRSARVAIAPVIYSVGIQNKILEAMAAGRPVVTTSSGASGFQPGVLQALALADTSCAFAAEIIHLCISDRYAETLRQRAYQYVARHHDWDAVTRRFESLYETHAMAVKVA